MIIFKVLVCTIIKINLFFFTSIRKVVNDHMNVWLFKYVFQVVICKKKNFFFKFKGLKQPRWLVPLRKHHLLSMNITEIRLLKTPIKARWLHWNLPARNLTRAFSFLAVDPQPTPRQVLPSLFTDQETPAPRSWARLQTRTRVKLFPGRSNPLVAEMDPDHRRWEPLRLLGDELSLTLAWPKRCYYSV